MGHIRRAAGEPWLLLMATIATGCAITLVAVRWLATLGVIRDYAVIRTAGSGSYSTATAVQREFGLGSGPSGLLTRVDRTAWAVGFATGFLWMVHLARRTSGYRIGLVRSVAAICGLGLFVATGAMHRTADAVLPEPSRSRANLLITMWCGSAAFSALVIGWSVAAGAPDSSGLGFHPLAVPLRWSIARSVAQLLIVVGGWTTAAFLTLRWARRTPLRPPRSAVRTTHTSATRA